MEQVDILISGGGIAGLTAACAFGSAGFKTLCVDPTPPITSQDHENADLRSTAFLQPARELLERAGLWQHLSPDAAHLQIMRIVDAGGETADAREVADFNASDISDAPFGWNFPNWLLRREMLKRIEQLENVTFLAGVATTKVTTRTDFAQVKLSNGKTIRTRLLIAADGRNSPVREAVGIEVKTWRYGQKALAFSVTHQIPHENISTEVHRTGGPFTLVPLPDLDGKPHSAVIWMETGPNIAKLNALTETDFNEAITERSANIYGPLKLTTRRSTWPIISQRAEHLCAQRTALIAEAAHVAPPIGAQGLNMSLGDIANLLDLAQANPETLGNGAMLDKYHKSRWPEIRARVAGIDLLNRTAMAQNPQLRDLRRAGLKFLHSATPIRKNLMRAGLGMR